MNFEINICPLCQKLLKEEAIGKCMYYSCPVEFIVPGGSHYITSHYLVESSNNDDQCVQRIYIYPWTIDTIKSKSRIYKYIIAADKWQFIKELPPIKPDFEDYLINRINKLMLFL